MLKNHKTSSILIYCLLLNNINMSQGLKFCIVPSLFDEEVISKESFKSPIDYVQFIAHQKALTVAEQFCKEKTKCLVIGADTVIVGKTK